MVGCADPKPLTDDPLWPLLPPEFKVHVIGLDDSLSVPSHSGAPVPGFEAVADCQTGDLLVDSEWPCVVTESLNAFFVDSDGDPICGYVVNERVEADKCVSFEPGGVWTYADLIAAPEYLAGGACKQLVDLGNDASSCMEPAGAPPAAQHQCTTDEFNQQLAALAQACDWPEVISPDPTVINVFFAEDDGLSAANDNSLGIWNGWLMSNYDDVEGINNTTAKMCNGAVFLDVDRLPSTPGAVAFNAGATQHEMGHAFGLDHHCAPAADSGGTVTVLPPDQSDNAMTSAYDDECCFECAGNRVDPTPSTDADVVADLGTSVYWTEVAVDCSSVGNHGSTTTDCAQSDDYLTCDDTCADGQEELYYGSRDNGFTDSIPGEWNDDASDWRGQLEVIREFAGTRLHCQAVSTEARQQPEVASSDPPCLPGSGEFRLIPDRAIDPDGNDEARIIFRPVLEQGDHLSPAAWITSASLDDAGGYGHVLVGQLGTVPTPLASNPDVYDSSTVARLDAGTPELTFALGQAATTGWLMAEGVALPVAAGDAPTVTLAWDCGGGPAPVVRELPPAWRLPLSALSPLVLDEQELLVRFDPSQGHLWFELRGVPATRRRGTLAPTATPHVYDVEIEVRGTEVTGTADLNPGVPASLTVVTGEIMGVDLSGETYTTLGLL